MGCKPSKPKVNLRPESREEILEAIREGNLAMIRGLIENNRTQDLEFYTVRRMLEMRDQGIFSEAQFCIYKKTVHKTTGGKRVLWEKGEYKDLLGFGRAIAEAAISGQAEVFDYLLESGKSFHFRSAAGPILRDGNLEALEKVYRTKAERRTGRSNEKADGLLVPLISQAIEDDQPGAIRALLSWGPEVDLPADLIGEARSLRAFEALLGDARLDPNLSVEKVAREGTYEMLRTLLADPRVVYCAKIAETMTAAAKSPVAPVRKLELLAQRLPEGLTPGDSLEAYTRPFHEMCGEAVPEAIEWFIGKMRGHPMNSEAGLRLLLHRGARMAAEGDNPRALGLLLEKKYSGKKPRLGGRDGANHLFAYICGYDPPAAGSVECLLSSRWVDPAFDDNVAFVNACRAGNAPAVALLLADPRVDPRVQNSAGAKAANDGGHREVVRLILADPRANPGPAPEYGSGKGKEEVAPPPSYAGYERSSYGYSYCSEE